MFHGGIILSVSLEEDLLGWGGDGIGGLAYLLFVLHTDLCSRGYFGVKAALVLNKFVVFLRKFHRNLFPRVQLTTL